MSVDTRGCELHLLTKRTADEVYKASALNMRGDRFTNGTNFPTY